MPLQQKSILNGLAARELMNGSGNVSATLACGLAGEVVRTFGDVRLRVFGSSMPAARAASGSGAGAPFKSTVPVPAAYTGSYLRLVYFQMMAHSEVTYYGVSGMWPTAWNSGKSRDGSGDAG
jgi:hypothetical protein